MLRQQPEIGGKRGKIWQALGTDADSLGFEIRDDGIGHIRTDYFVPTDGDLRVREATMNAEMVSTGKKQYQGKDRNRREPA